VGLEVSYLDFMSKHINNCFGDRSDLKMLELGNQHISPNEIYRYRTGKNYFQSLGYNHVSIDINGHDGAEIRDLRAPDQFTNLYNKFDILTNSGTTEHVEPHHSQFDCWKILHDCLRPTGLFLHILPDVDELDSWGHWKGHCSLYYSDKFFQILSLYCNYEILESCVINGLRAVAIFKKPNSRFAINRQLLLDSISQR